MMHTACVVANVSSEWPLQKYWQLARAHLLAFPACLIVATASALVEVDILQTNMH